jgi:AraC-like DNA-binding protein
VGFSDQPAFNRSFREIVGTSPGQWRRANAPMPKAFKLFAQDEESKAACHKATWDSPKRHKQFL